jgi:UPF0755 protein
MRRARRPLIIGLGMAAAALVAGAVWLTLQAVGVGGPGSAVVINVHNGEGLAQVAGELQSAGVVDSAFAYRTDAAIFGGPTLTPGYYSLARNSSFASVNAVLSGSPNAVVLEVRPGLTLHEIAVDLAAQTSDAEGSAFLRAAQSASRTSDFHPRGSLEGLVGSGEYIYPTSVSVSRIVSDMTTRFTDQARAAGVVPGTTINGLSAYQAVIAASIVEKEGYYPKNMPKVARVILNRLARGAGLQMDSTILYALGMDGGTVTPAMLRIASPYNTYLNAGLTPTPICVVSNYALHAVAHPPAGSWYYFTLVSRDGTEAFATTFDQQLANERLAASRGL